jgi:hypothetical protein
MAERSLTRSYGEPPNEHGRDGSNGCKEEIRDICQAMMEDPPMHSLGPVDRKGPPFQL